MAVLMGLAGLSLEESSPEAEKLQERFERALKYWPAFLFDAALVALVSALSLNEWAPADMARVFATMLIVTFALNVGVRPTLAKS